MAAMDIFNIGAVVIFRTSTVNGINSPVILTDYGVVLESPHISLRRIVQYIYIWLLLKIVTQLLI